LFLELSGRTYLLNEHFELLLGSAFERVEHYAQVSSFASLNIFQVSQKHCDGTLLGDKLLPKHFQGFLIAGLKALNFSMQCPYLLKHIAISSRPSGARNSLYTHNTPLSNLSIITHTRKPNTTIFDDA
jgi:hypothetical protein